MTSALPLVVRPADPIALERRLRGRAMLARWHADRVSVALLALVWCAVLAVVLLLAWSLAHAHGARLLALASAQLPACALLVFAATLLAEERALLAAARRWRAGWLAALPGNAGAVPRQLSRAALRRSLLRSAALWLVPPLLLAASGHADARWPAGWWLVVAAPWPAAALARALVAWRGNGARAASGRERPSATWILAGLPVAARWQWAAWARAQRGRAAAWLLLPLLLALPAGMSPPGSLLALLAAFATGALLTFWSTALRVLPRAAALLRATPCSARRFLAAQLLLPATLLSIVGSGLAVLLVGAAGARAGVLVLFPLAAALLHAGVACSERFRPRRIGPLLALHLGLQVGAWQAFPPLSAPLLLLQLASLARRALRQ